ncbi:MAG: imidazole glycerol phosphate synthase, glutamine amidotransferase subunit [Omnitrophica bacterium GWA2_41_15]|nr:MAG: imidazole glycerol phosphate synthase, glutamine amidotransferase subunit [Omnitrophica bacterium GWA2_41_15]HAZ10950.1 imidazole glycerol phosphate synthase subunit HisH [Candidatus Omnitrophota bacterium]
MIVIIDYGMGNLRSVQKAFEKFCSNVIVSSSAKDILKADKIILPGVGAFKVAMEELKKRDLIEPIKDSIEKGRPFLGICLGLQLLFTESEEGGKAEPTRAKARGSLGECIKGLDIIKGKVRRFKERDGLKIPHMGWNRISLKFKSSKLKVIDGVEDGSYMYFVHSYYAVPKDKNVILCETDYGWDFASGVRKDNVYGFQFHPEKSQSMGLKIIENFVNIIA